MCRVVGGALLVASKFRAGRFFGGRAFRGRLARGLACARASRRRTTWPQRVDRVAASGLHSPNGADRRLQFVFFFLLLAWRGKFAANAVPANAAAAASGGHGGGQRIEARGGAARVQKPKRPRRPAVAAAAGVFVRRGVARGWFAVCTDERCCACEYTAVSRLQRHAERHGDVRRVRHLRRRRLGLLRL